MSCFGNYFVILVSDANYEDMSPWKWKNHSHFLYKGTSRVSDRQGLNTELFRNGEWIIAWMARWGSRIHEEAVESTAFGRLEASRKIEKFWSCISYIRLLKLLQQTPDSLLVEKEKKLWSTWSKKRKKILQLVGKWCRTRVEMCQLLARLVSTCVVDDVMG